jgi:hypothetical protein
MKFTNISVALLALLTFTTKLAPTYATTVQQETQTSKTEIQTRSTHTTNSATSAQVVMMNQKVETTQKIQRIIPASAAIAIGFPDELVLNARKETVATLRTAQPVYDEQGEEVAPINSLISARLKPTKGGVEIVADSLLIRGRVVPIQASSIVVPGQSVTMISGAEHAKEASMIGSKLGGQALGAINPENFVGIKSGAMAGGAVGILFGLFSPKKETVVKIPQGSIYILSVQSAVILP